MEAEIINILFFQIRKALHANATLHHYSEFSKHSWNLPGRRLSCIMLGLSTLPNMSSRVVVRDFRLKHTNNGNIHCNRGSAKPTKVMH